MKKLTLIVLLAFSSSCNGQTKTSHENASTGNTASYSGIKNPVEANEGVVYFSMNNGLSWESKNEGLPDSTTIPLGAIAVSDKSLGIVTKEKGIFLFDFQKDLWRNIPTDKKIIESNPGPLIFFKGHIYVGTQTGGVFWTSDRGETWTKLNSGLANFTIRKFIQIDNTMYAGTNAGLYSFHEIEKQWEWEYGNNTMQVNGITEFDGNIYIGTNQGAFTSPKRRKEWTPVLTNRTLHNISSDENTLYAMTYNELFASTDRGLTWKSIQNGLPAELYTFNVIKNNHSVFAGQWDGVYRKDVTNGGWKSSSNGLPEKLAINNMKFYNGIIVVSGSERRLRGGMTMDKK